MARKYVRDNRGRFASGGGGATARGGRLKTASGSKRATQTMKAAGAGGVIKGRTARTVAGEKVMAKLAKRAPTKAAPSQKPGTVPLNQVRRYNALDRARYKQKQKYSREMSVVTGAVGPGALQRIDRSFKEAKLASRKTSRIEATMRRLSNSPNSPNVPVLPRAKQLGEMVTGRRNLYRRMTPRITASPVAGTIKKPAPKPPGPPTPTGSRTRSQARAAQRNRREQVLDRGRTGVTGLGSMRKNPRIRKVQTGMSQLSLMGKAKPLVRFKPAGRRR